MKIKLGVMAVDKVTGFKGIVTGKAKYLHDCTRFLLTPECKDDKPFHEGEWFAAPRLLYLGEGYYLSPVK